MELHTSGGTGGKRGGVAQAHTDNGKAEVMFDQNAGLGDAMARSHTNSRVDKLEREVQELRLLVTQQREKLNALIDGLSGGRAK